VLPGNYLVKLTLGKEEQIKPIVVEEDPRLAHLTRERKVQYDTLMRLGGLQKSATVAQRTLQGVRRQVTALHERTRPGDWDRVVLAYEPVWASGTGRNATPDDAAPRHALIRFELGRRGVSGRVTILYGGSVNQGNVLSLLARPELDGVLVGGASLDPDGWAELVGHGA
jgi:triosephosphate isomerase